MSTYREEREALRARAEGLEQELAQVRGELADAQGALQRSQQGDPMERIEQLERDLAAAQRALGEIRAQVASTERPPPRPMNGAAVVAAVMGLIVVGSGASMFLIARTAAPPPPPTIRVAPPPAPAPAPQPEAPRPVEQAPEEVTFVTAHWEGSVVSAAGLDLKAGAPCSAEATLARAGEAVEVRGLTVRCGGVDLYRSADELNGISMNRAAVTHEAGPEGTRYALIYDDTGDRTGPRSQISLGTAAGEARVWRATVPSFDVKLRLKRLSSPPEAR